MGAWTVLKKYVEIGWNGESFSLRMRGEVGLDIGYGVERSLWHMVLLRSANFWVFGGQSQLTFGQLALAGVASCLTIYLSSSAQHITSKDSTFLLPPFAHTGAVMENSPAKTSTERQSLLNRPQSLPGVESVQLGTVEVPRKVMYYAAGSGIPEIKTILSGELWFLAV
jgi:hypothetical protein